MGITVLPLLQLKARALEGLAASKTKISKLFGFPRFTYTAASFFYGSMIKKFYFCNKLMTLVIWVFKIFAFLMCSLEEKLIGFSLV